MNKIPEDCISWLCLLACIKNPDKCPEYYLSMFGIYRRRDTKKRQKEHLEWYIKNKKAITSEDDSLDFVSSFL